MTDLCQECGQYTSEGCRAWCSNAAPPAVVYHYTTPKARTTDPTTSHAAAATVTTTTVTETQQRILDAYRAHGPLTDEELCQRLAVETRKPVSVSGIRTRRSELVDAGQVHDTGTTKATATGRAAIVWSCA